MSAWGPGGAAKSCDALLTRVEENDPTLQELVILSNKTFGDAQANRLSTALALGKNTCLKSLSASGHELSPSALERLGSAIATGKSNLVSLAIGHAEMGDEGTAALCKGLDSNASNNIGGGLQQIDLEWKDLSTNAMAALGRTFGPSPCFLKLNCSRNERIQDEGILAFCSSASNRCRELGLAYHSFPSLQELNLAECRLRAAGVEALVELLGNFASSQRQDDRSLSLNLSDNPLGIDACCALASLLCDSPLISSLIIAGCGIGSDGMSILSAAIGMESCDCVEVLDLSNNGIGEAGAKSLASSFSKWTRLNDLRLSGNSIGASGVEALMSAIETSGCNHLSLDLTKTNCGVVGATAAVNSSRIASLRLFNNTLGSDGLDTLALLLQGGHPFLVNLDLGGNDAGEDAVVTLLNAIADINGVNFVSTLRVLEIGGNSGGDAVEEAVARLKRVHPELDVARDRRGGQQNRA